MVEFEDDENLRNEVWGRVRAFCNEARSINTSDKMPPASGFQVEGVTGDEVPELDGDETRYQVVAGLMWEGFDLDREKLQQLTDSEVLEDRDVLKLSNDGLRVLIVSEQVEVETEGEELEAGRDAVG